ncbi:MAG: UvrD-helicase domain-containing protein [Candidatus Sulfotelmatobacter sp.]
MSDTKHRRRALTDHTSTLLVEAGAGTGKTSLLAGRVALLLASGVHPRNVAAITFTELAASELLQRIQEYVRELVSGNVPEPLQIAMAEDLAEAESEPLSLAASATDGLTDKQMQSLSSAAAALDELTCTTIHGFCQRLTTPYPIEANVDPGAVMMDEGEADLNHKTLLRQWLRKRLEGPQADAPLAELLVIEGEQGLRLIEQLAEARRARRTARAPEAKLSQKHIDEFRKSVSSFRKWYAGAQSLGLQEPTTEEYISGFEVLVAQYASGYRVDTSFRQLWGYAHPQQISAMKKNSYELRQYKCKGKWVIAAKSTGQSQAKADRHNGEACALYERVAESLQILVGLAAESAQSQLISALDDFQASFVTFKRESALLDFDDLLYFARDLLRTHPAVRAALTNRYQHILVDEFQDTDPLQSEILFLLCGEYGADKPWHEQQLRPGQLFLVGDPKQSVYRFRRADIRSYKEAKDAIQRQWPENVLPITDNFRSRGPILDFVNQRFALPLSSIGYEPLVSTVTSSSKEAFSIGHIPIGKEGSEYKVYEWRELEAQAVAQLCYKLIGRFTVREKDELVPCRPGDIALLAPTGTDLWIFERALEEMDIPIATQAGKGFFIRQEVHDLVAIARILSNSRDTLALGALLRGPLVGLTEHELLDIVVGLPQRDGEYGRLRLWTDAAEINHPLAAEVIRVLQGLGRRAYQTSPFDILSAAVEELHVRAILAQRHPRYVERALANVERFLEMAKPYSVRGLRVFADDMTRLWEEGEREVEGRADATHDAVHIVSIHSAKGLEWPVVIPINLVTATRPATGVLHRATDDTLHFGLKTLNPPEYQLLKEVENRELGEERIRLLYVACTRARDLLVFPHYLGKLGNGWHKQVDLSLDDLPEYPTLDLKEAERKPTAPPLSEQTPEAFRQEALRLVEQTMNIRWIQPSAVEIDEIPLPPPPEDEFAEPVVDVRGSATRGRVLHKLMEEIFSGETRDDDAGIQTRATELLGQLGENDHPDPSEGPSSQEIASTIARTLRVPIVAQYRHVLQPEFGVLQLRSDKRNETVGRAGIVDAIAYNLEGSPEVVFDWKSDVALTPDARQHHASQVREYLDCTEAARGFVVYMTTGELQEVAKGRSTGNVSGEID